MNTWVKRWGYLVRPKKPGVYELKTGGFLVRVSNTTRSLPWASLREAEDVRDALRRTRNAPSLPLWGDFAVSLFEEKILRGDISSEKTKDRWDEALKYYLIPAFGGLRVDQVTNASIAEWAFQVAKWIRHGKKSLKTGKHAKFEPTTANGILRILKTVCAAMKTRFALPLDPADGVSLFRERSKYSEENPNSLSHDQLREWLRIAREKYPQHYAIMLLGFVTGRRPGELRALEKTDINWKTKRLSITKAHTVRREIRNSTKQDEPVYVTLPDFVLDVIRDHIAGLPPGKQRESKLMFPSRTGGIRSRSGLDKPFEAIRKQLRLPFKVTPRAMRRSFQDLARAAEVSDFVTRSISGHATPKMQEHYSTARGPEQKASLDKMVELLK